MFDYRARQRTAVGSMIVISAFYVHNAQAQQSQSGQDPISPLSCSVVGLGNDCNRNGTADVCDTRLPKVDVIFYSDTSVSMLGGPEERGYCELMDRVYEVFNNYDVHIEDLRLGLTASSPCVDCPDECSVQELISDWVPGDPGPGCSDILDHNESWAPATAIVAALSPWREGSVRIAVPLFDEGPYEGDETECDECDIASIENATALAIDNGVWVFPIISNLDWEDMDDCIVRLSSSLGEDTGGAAFNVNNEIVYANEWDDLKPAFLRELMIRVGTVAGDCNINGKPDECDVRSGYSNDRNANDIPDECEEDCNANDTPDFVDTWLGMSDDCNDNGVPDECEVYLGSDCNRNGKPDYCDIADGLATDCNENGVPDWCERIDGDVRLGVEGVPCGTELDPLSMRPIP